MKYATLLCLLVVCAPLLVQPADAVVLTCNVNGDSAVNAIDVQLVINAALGIEPDSDGDGLSDAYEIAYDGDPSSYDPYPEGGDLDADNPDTDGDAVSDGVEIDAGTDPLDPASKPADSDGDMLYDYLEDVYETDPNEPDSDFDGLPDGEEIYTYYTVPTDPDTDGDSLSDGDEVNTYGTEPTDPDTDSDGLNDGEEVNTYSTSPTDSDSDSDQLPDGWEVSYGLSPVSNAGDSSTDGNPDGDAFSNLVEYQNGTDPTAFDGVPTEDFSGTWTGSFESTDSTIYPNDALPYGYLIATIEQTGALVTVTFPVGNGGLTGTVSGDTLTAAGTSWMGDPLSFVLTISGTEISGTYSAGAASSIDQGTCDLTLTSGPAAQIQAGDWYGTFEDKYESTDRPIHAVFFTSIEVPAVSQLVMNVEYQDSEDPDRVYPLPGRIAGNVFMAMFQEGEDTTCFSGVIENDGHIMYSYDSRWVDDDINEFSWGEIEQWVSPGALVDMTGAWRTNFQEIYSNDHESGAVDITLTQTGTQLTMQVPGENTLLSGEVRGNTFVMIGPNGSDEPMRFDGVLDNGQISGTHDTDEDDGWTWGTYTAQRDGLPPEDFSGTWTGAFESTDSTVYPNNALPYGYLIATVEQTGSQVTVTFPVGDGGLTGTVSGDTLTADGTFWTGDPASVTLTISGTQLSGTYTVGAGGNMDQGTCDLTLASGPAAQIQTGDWYGTVEDKYDSEGYPTHHVFFSDIETPSGSQLILNAVYENIDDPSEVFPLPGRIAGNVFMLMHAEGDFVVYVTGVVEDDDHISGTWEEADEHGFAWGEVEQWASPGPLVDMNGSWRVSIQDVYSDDPETGIVNSTFIQNGASLTATDDTGSQFTGEVRGNMFVMLGQNVDGDPQRIDGMLEGSVASGTYEGHDADDPEDDWWWGTLTAERR